MNRLNRLLDDFVTLCTELTTRHPMCVVIAMHEYFRSLWPNDPYIPEKKARDPIKHIEAVLVDSIAFLRTAGTLGSYFRQSSGSSDNGDVRFIESGFGSVAGHTTEAVYGRLWAGLTDDQISTGAARVLQMVFQNNNEGLDAISGKTVLDLGCGSGRFSFALARLGAHRVIGVDLGKEAMQRARSVADRHGIGNIEFIQGNVLDLPFCDESFDFVWCKGVLHHTGSLVRGLDEYFRVMKSGGRGYLYLYGSGGLHWTSRDRMREIMKLIPLDYTMRVLALTGMPPQRYVFADSWFVPIEQHVQRAWLESEFDRRYVASFSRADDRGEEELENMTDSDRLLWGDGDLRYFVTK